MDRIRKTILVMALAGLLFGGTYFLTGEAVQIHSSEVSPIDSPDMEKRQQGYYALEFDGIDDCVEIPEIAALRTQGDRPLTVEFWMWVDSYPKPWRKMLSKWGSGGGQDDEFVFSLRPNGTFGFANTGRTGLDSQIVIPLGQWCHLCCVWDSVKGRYSLYLNGESTFPSLKGGQPLQLTGETIRVGTDGHRTQCFRGKLDEIRIWDKALDEDQVTFYMNKRLTDDEPGLVGYWSFDEGRGQVVNDRSVKMNRGRLGYSPFTDKADPKWVVSEVPLEDYPSPYSERGTKGRNQQNGFSSPKTPHP